MFSQNSLKQLRTCHPDLQELFFAVVEEFDCTILEGERDEETQNILFTEGKSKVTYPNSKHNNSPSLAVDVAPYPIDWEDTDRFYYFAGFVMGVASQLGIKIRFGGDWNKDNQVKDTRFKDLCHFEMEGK